MNDKLKSNCEPCQIEEIFIPKKIEPICKVKEIKDETNSHMYPKYEYVEVQENCLKEMLINMTKNKFCRIPPTGCNK